jgi:phosphoenolpyruvate phosphomutase
METLSSDSEDSARRGGMMESKTTILRRHLAGTETLMVAGVHDGLSAKVAERHGFAAVWASGLGISAVQAVPDASILTMGELLSATVIINDACDVPVIADCDSGFGNVHNVTRMVRKYEGAGIAGVCIEDKTYPKLNSFVDGPQALIPTAEFCAKIRAGKAAQRNPDFVIIARVEALIAGLGQQEAQLRASAYAAAGADAILIHSRSSDPDEVLTFARQWSGAVPLVVVPTKYPSITLDEIARVGIRVVIFANHALRASVTAMDDAFSELRRQGSSQTIEASIAPLTQVFELQGVSAMKALEKRIAA